MSDNHRSSAPAAPHYTALPSGDGTWHFTTPTGSSSGWSSQSQCQRFAESTERQDRETAAAGTGPFAATLAAHFSAPAPA